MDPRLDPFLAFVSQKTGPAPAPFGTWADLAAALRGIEPEVLATVFDDVEQSFTVDTSDERYERWSEAKRVQANRAAAAALRAAVEAGGVATAEQRRAINAYTGFGGIRHIGVLPPEYPKAYVDASRIWIEKAAGVVPPHVAAIMERVKDQYFTGLDVCRAAMQLAVRVSPTGKDYLEPSAGIGRMPRVAPAGISWTLCELDDLMFAMLQVLYPEARRHRGFFETYAKAARGRDLYDVVIGNPPYGARPPESLALDLRGTATFEDYFTLAGASLLRPGGSLVYVVPLSTLTRTAGAKTRASMLAGCAFRGAAILPHGAFPNVMQGTFAITVWTRRGERISEAQFDEREKRIAAGGYLGLDEARAAVCGGEWRKGLRGDYLHGTPDFSRLGSLWLAPPPAHVEVAQPIRPEPTRPTVPEVEPVTQAEIDEAASDVGTALGKTVADWILTIATDPDGAESRRDSIRTQVVQYVAEHGNPHPKGPAGLRAVVTPDGGLEPVLLNPISIVQFRGDILPDDATIAQTVEFWCETKGYAEASDLPMGTSLDAVARDPDVLVDMRPEGPVFFTRWAYFTGNPTALLAACDRALAGGLPDAFREKIQAQKATLLKLWSGGKTIQEIDATPRSPFVPIEAVAEWINSVIFKENTEFAFEFRVENGILEPVHNETYQRAARSDWKLDLFYWTIGYYNRTRNVAPVDGSPSGVGIYGNGDAEAQQKIDNANVEKFRDWLSGSSWVPAIEAEYNSRFAPGLTGFIPTSPVHIDGQSPLVRLHPHQNQAIRRCSLGNRARPFLYALGTGGGKTFTGIATSLRWRQRGAARRIAVVVPNSVIGKWLDDGLKLAPNSNVGLIGVTKTGKGKSIADTPDMRLEKWLRFAAGMYDYVIVGHTTFLRDVEPDMDLVADVMVNVAWARRGAAEEIAGIRRLQEKLDWYRARLKEVEAVQSAGAWKTLTGRWANDWAERRAAKIIEYTDSIRKMETDIQDILGGGDSGEGIGTDRQIATVQQRIRADLEDKPYRPSDGEEEEEEEEEEGEDGDPDGTPKKKRHNPLPGLVLWSQIGIDALVVDEAHYFKNVWYPKAKIEYAGKGEDKLYKVKRSWDMFIKTRLVHRRAGGVGGVFFLTATPMTNSPLELYALLDMVNPRLFEDAGIYDKEAFIDRYWKIDTTENIKADGSVVVSPAVTGFKNLNEMMNVANTSFERLSTKDLVDRGWLPMLPTAEPEKLFFQRDLCQTMILRNLTSLYVGWIKADEEDEAGGFKRNSACGLTEMVDTSIWTIANGELRPLPARGGNPGNLRSNLNNRPDILSKNREENPLGRMARGTFQLIWMSMLDKVAMAPTLLLEYAKEKTAQAADLGVRYRAWAEYREAREKKGGPKPPRPPGKPPKTSDFVTSTVAAAILDYIDLDIVQQWYKDQPIVPKIAELARRIAANVDQMAVVVHASPRAVAGAGVEQVSIAGEVDDPTTRLTGQARFINAAVETLRGEGIRCETPKSLGRCGHVVFCDATELYPQIRAAIVQATGGAIPANRVATLPKDKTQRLAASQAFNGADATSLAPAVEPRYDVMIGSSKLMAEGVDLQRRSCAVHHLDLPWEPATLQQRNGRAVRQGNQMGRVDVIYYLTSNSFDALRFDKIARKAMWWEALFSGQSSTSNPAADKSGASSDVDELILSMVIEDPDVLQACLAQRRTEREIERIQKLRVQAKHDWTIVNAAFSKARATVDPTRRPILFEVAARKLQSFHMEYRDLVTPEMLRVVPERAVGADFGTGRFFSAGYAFAVSDAPFKVLDVQVRAADMMATVRKLGEWTTTSLLVPNVLSHPEAETWDSPADRAGLVEGLLRYNCLTSLAYPPADVKDDLALLWASVIERCREKPSYMLGVLDDVSPLFVFADGTVGVLMRPRAAEPSEPGDTYRSSFGGGTIRADEIIRKTPALDRIVPLGDLDARGIFLAAVREDRLVMARPEQMPKRSVYERPSWYLASWEKPRMSPAVWILLAQALFGSGMKTKLEEVLRQRVQITGEKPRAS